MSAFPLVRPNGDLTVVYNSILAGLLQVSQTSHDGGSTFDPPVTIAAFQGIGVAGMRTGDFLPAAAVDPVSGHLYAVWQDARFRSDGFNDIVISVSTDGGASWGPVRAVNASAAHPVNHFTAAVGAHGGTVLVSYVTRADDDDRVDVRYVVSTDDGTSFGRERRLGGAGNLRFAASSSGRSFLGDYMGLAVSATAAHAVWCRPSRPRRGPTADHHQTTWSATIAR